MKTKLLFVVSIAVVLAFSVSIPAGAGDAAAGKAEFEGTWCRYEVITDPPTTTTVLPSGRILRKHGEAFFDVTSDDPRVAGVFDIFDLTYNLGPAEPVDGPKPLAREGFVHGNFILTPYDSEINGTWEGRWKCSYTIEDGWAYLGHEAVGKGTGDLAGLQIRVKSKAAVYAIDCDKLDPQYPNPFNGYILDPNAQNE